MNSHLSMIKYIFILLLFMNVAAADEPKIKIIYPRLSAGADEIYISSVDSNFIFGNVSDPHAMLKINGTPVPLYQNGTFLAYLPVDWNSMSYVLKAETPSANTTEILEFSKYPKTNSVEKPEFTFPMTGTLRKGVIRNHLRGAYYMFQDSETEVILRDWRNHYFEIKLHPSKSVWVQDRYVQKQSPEVDSSVSVCWKAAIEAEERWINFRLPIGKKVLYRVENQTNSKRIQVELYGVISHIDRINITDDALPIRLVNWDHPYDGVLRLTFDLDEKCWGYKTLWDKGDFILKIRKTPELKRNLKGLTIAVDPGHGGDQSGAVGPAGTPEKEANLRVARELKRRLSDRGINVISTREDDRTLGLSQRIEIAETLGADLLISVHHNALPDGVNPFTEFGTETYYYQPQSIDLAKYIQLEIQETIGLTGGTLAYNNLALVRPTSMPAVLIEAAYIMFPEHEMLINHPEYPKYLSEAIYRGLVDFVNEWRTSQ